MRRVDAFSDAVFAIAITLLVLELPFERVGQGKLLDALADRWPSFATYAVSFLTIGIAWMHHHALWDQIGRPDRRLLVLNLLALMTVAFVPFPTGLLGDYIRQPGDAETAAVVFGATWMLAALANAAIWAYACRHRELLREGVDPAGVR